MAHFQNKSIFSQLRSNYRCTRNIGPLLESTSIVTTPKTLSYPPENRCACKIIHLMRFKISRMQDRLEAIPSFC